MSESKINYSSWFKPWWKGLLVIGLFPFTLSYIVWKQNWKLPVRLGLIAVIWVVFIGLGSSESNQPESSQTAQVQEETTPTPTPEPTYTLEQKQTDFKAFYEEYVSKAQGMIIIQAGLISLSESASSAESLYLALEEMKQTQSGLAQLSLDLEVPESLKEYKQLSSAKTNLFLAADYFKKSIDDFQKYINKNDFESLSSAKQKSDRGTVKLNESKDAIDEVAKELGIDLESLKKTE